MKAISKSTTDYPSLSQLHQNLIGCSILGFLLHLFSYVEGSGIILHLDNLFPASSSSHLCGMNVGSDFTMQRRRNLRRGKTGIDAELTFCCMLLCKSLYLFNSCQQNTFQLVEFAVQDEKISTNAYHLQVWFQIQLFYHIFAVNFIGTYIHTYIIFHRSKVSQNDCRMWNKSYKYKSHTVQLRYKKK